MSAFAIRTENLGKTYRSGSAKKKSVTALHDLSLEIREGEIFGFLGPNGAGKTTTIHLLLDLMRPSSGAAYIFGEPAGDVQVRRRLGYLPETVVMHEHYSARGLLHFYAELTGLPAVSRASRVEEMLSLLKLSDAADRAVSKFSKGMQQRLGFAQALLHDPDLVILDEPTASLDPVARKEFRDIVLTLKARGKTVLISSHILSEVESICDRVAILTNGKLARIGTLQELSAPKSVRITVIGVNGVLIEALATTAAEITLLLGETAIKCSDEISRAKVMKILDEHRVAIARTEVETQSLEEIFFAAVAEGRSR